MKEKMHAEVLKRVEILKANGMNEDLCEKIKAGEFVLLGHTIEPKPKFEDCKKLKEEFEKEYKAIVLFGLLSVMEDTQMLCLVYVSKYKEDWDFDEEELQAGSAIAQVYNLTDNYNEMGGILFEFNENGYPVRTA